MTSNERSQSKTCHICSKNMGCTSDLAKLIEESYDWFSAHPPAVGEFPAFTNLQQMLIEGCDFASIILDCVAKDRVTAAYANARCLLDRCVEAVNQIYEESINWNREGMARQQNLLDNMLQDAPSHDREWMKERNAQIRRWNSQDGKPKRLSKPGAYRGRKSEMPAELRGVFESYKENWYDFYSLYVHPTFLGKQNIDRPFHANEINALTKETHHYLCLIKDITFRVAEIQQAYSQNGRSG